MTSPTKFAGADWLRQCGKDLSPFGAEVADILGQVYAGIYHIDSEVLHKRCDWSHASRIEVVISDSHNGGLSTFDFNHLTAMVVLCHDRCVRLTVAGASRNHLRLVFHQRLSRRGSTCERHPTLFEAAKDIRDRRGLRRV
jgi:hypothetical protein